MCQYSCSEGLANDWHLVHLGSRASGGASLVMVEATAVNPKGRISPKDCGLWNDEQMHAFKNITAFIKSQGSVPAIQLAHAGRKASTAAPWDGGKPLPVESGGWKPLGPSAIAFDSSFPTPKVMDAEDIRALIQDFESAALRANSAGFDVVEIHMAHGYLLHEFLSPLANKRTDDFGGTLEKRMKLPLTVAHAVRKIWPQDKPVFVRISASDWVEGGWDLEQSIAFAQELKKIGTDLIDCSSGGMVPSAKIPIGPGYQVPFSESIRNEAQIATGAVGLIKDPQQAEAIIAHGQADVVLLARAFLNDPYWPVHAAEKLGVNVVWPRQYGRR